MNTPDREELVGRRLRLVPVAEADLEPLQQWFEASDPLRLTCRPVPKLCIEETRSRFHERKAGERQDSEVFAIRLLDTDELVGRIAYFDLNPRNRATEVGFLIGPPFRKRGFAREALDCLLRYLFEGLDLNKAVAQTGAFNHPAIALLEQVGFKRDGRLRRHHLIDGVLEDDLLFSILASEHAMRSVDLITGER